MLLLYRNMSGGGLRVVESTGFNREALDAYCVDGLGGDELIRESMDGPAGIIVSSTRLARGKKLRLTRIHQRLLIPSDLAHLAGAAALNKSSVYASMWMARSSRSPALSVHDLYSFRSLLPHVARAMTVHPRVCQAELQASMAIGAFDRVAVGVVLLDVKGAPVMVNRQAERIVAMKDGFALLGNGPVAARSSETKALRELIREVDSYASQVAPVERGSGGAVRLTRPSGRPDYHVVVLPLPMWCQPGHGSGAVAVLFITDTDRSQSPADYLFGDLYGLTHAETRLVTQVLRGGGLTAAAEELGLSRNTAHSQLASVFQKTGTRRQGELLRLLVGGIAPIEAPDANSGAHAPVSKPRRPTS